jgi:hypothetical protein
MNLLKIMLVMSLLIGVRSVSALPPDVDAGWANLASFFAQYGRQPTNLAEAVAYDAAVRNATPITFDQSIQFLGAAGPAMRGTDGHWYQPVPDPEAGDWLAIPRTGSPWHPDATFTNTAAAVIAERKAHRAAIRAIKLDLDQCATNLAQVAVSIDTINTSATGTLGVAIAATTGTTKTALTATRNVLGDLKAAVRNLRAGVEQNRQASEKLRREVR